MFELFLLFGGVSLALVSGWAVWRFIVVPGAVDDASYPLANCDISMFDEIKGDTVAIQKDSVDVVVLPFEMVDKKGV